MTGMIIFIVVMIFSAGFGPEPVDAASGTRDAAGFEDDSLEASGEFDAFEDFEEFDQDTGERVFDPLSGYNRVMTRVNDRLYYWLLKPLARGYGFLLPEPARKGIRNVFHNLGFPVRMVNNLLQLKVKQAGTETARFVVNSTVGVAGLWDPASGWLELPVYSEDFGQTLGHYGLGGGFHVVLPFLGPSNVRDICGRGADWFLDPVHYLEDADAETAISAVDTVNGASLRIGQYEAITEDALDLYILLRDGYRDRRNKAIEE